MKGHTATLRDVVAGIRYLPDVGDSFAATRAAWRFFGNEDTTLPVLMQPLLQVADAAARSSCSEVALVACDWCQLHYPGTLPRPTAPPRGTGTTSATSRTPPC